MAFPEGLNLNRLPTYLPKDGLGHLAGGSGGGGGAGADRPFFFLYIFFLPENKTKTKKNENLQSKVACRCP